MLWVESCYWELLLSDLLLHCSASSQGGREKLEDKETGCTLFQQLVGLSGCIVPTGFASSRVELVRPRMKLLHLGQQASWDCHRENRSVVWKLSYSLSWGHNLTLHVTAHHCTSSPSSLLLFELPASPLFRFQFLLSGFEALRVAARRFLIRRIWFHTSIYCGLCMVTLCHSFTQDLIKSTMYWARRPTSGKHWPAGTSEWTVSPPCCTAVTCRSLCSCCHHDFPHSQAQGCFFWRSSLTPQHIQGEPICVYWLAGICLLSSRY